MKKILMILSFLLVFSAQALIKKPSTTSSGNKGNVYFSSNPGIWSELETEVEEILGY
ncbi:MAG: hypothetical protein P4L22_05505 [Candidatus Babeliales bacterium]|nr:hypothetical protein [Candidatus Babeliales bacterium]